MSTAELKHLIDERTPEERQWMAAYLLDELLAAPELRQTVAELAELAKSRADMAGGRNRVSQVQALAHWETLDIDAG
jgi:hypothetical protein